MNYKETTLAGTSYQRCNRVNIINDLNQTPYIIFGEQKVINLGDEILVQGVNTNCTKVFDQNAVINIINPQTGEPTGSSVTHGELYAILHSLYIETATERDNAVIPDQV